MHVRNILLAALALAVLGAIVYLFIALGDDPATAVSSRAPAPPPDRGASQPQTRPDRPSLAVTTGAAPGSTASRPDPEVTPDKSGSGSHVRVKPPWPRNHPRTMAKPDRRQLGLRRASPYGRSAGGSDDVSADDRKRMAEASASYDRGDYDDALEQAGDVLASHPKNVRMLRVVVSSACITGDASTARRSLDLLPRRDQVQMRKRCAKHGIDL